MGLFVGFCFVWMCCEWFTFCDAFFMGVRWCLFTLVDCCVGYCVCWLIVVAFVLLGGVGWFSLFCCLQVCYAWWFVRIYVRFL